MPRTVPYAITIDQRASRAGHDEVDRWVRDLNAEFAPVLTLPFTRTVGDELQGLTDDPSLAVECALRGVRLGHWWTGVGIGRIETPLGASAIETRGPAFYLARDAVERAKKEPWGFKIIAHDPQTTGQIGTVLELVAFIVNSRGDGSRSNATWQAIELRKRGLTHAAIADELGITRQAVSRRLRVAGYREESHGRSLAEHLMEAADSTPDG